MALMRELLFLVLGGSLGTVSRYYVSLGVQQSLGMIGLRGGVAMGGEGGTLTCTVTAPTSQSTGLPTTIDQCNASGTTGASTVTIASIA